MYTPLHEITSVKYIVDGDINVCVKYKRLKDINYGYFLKIFRTYLNKIL